MTGAPHATLEFFYFRHRLMEDGMERIRWRDAQDTNVSVDITVQKKNITFPTDNSFSYLTL